MKNHIRRTGVALVLLALLVAALSTCVFASTPTDAVGNTLVTCSSCDGLGICTTCYGQDPSCTICSGTNLCPTCSGTGYVESTSHFFNTFWSLLPPIIAIVLALITKEVYSSLFIGILAGGILYANFNLEGTMNHVLQDGVVSVLSNSYNIGILLFLVMLGSLVCLLNQSGGSAAFGRWAETHIKSRIGAQLATIFLGCLIFVDDYFNCLTVGSVMRPITDKHHISRAKLAYLIDSTAAPICIIAPISSWAAAVAAFAADGEGLTLFIKAIPFNFYALLTIVTIIGLVVMKTDYGPMAAFEKHAKAGDLFSGKNPYASMEQDENTVQGKVRDLVIPILVLISACVLGMIYSGSFFDPASANYHSFVGAFSASDASVGLALGSSAALILSMLYFALRRTIRFQDIMKSIPDGFKAMVPAILILTFAWTLKSMTDSLGAIYFVRDFVLSSAMGMQIFLPALVFLIGCLLAFATGTSWGTFGMLIPIVQGVFPMDHPLTIVCIAACMSGAVCGDHCSPISDTTIMASAGAECDHVNHVNTQLPYAVTTAAVSFSGYLLTGILVTNGLSAIWALPCSIALMVLVLLSARMLTGRRVSLSVPHRCKKKYIV